ncbi:hypothetical protein COB72_11255 [bacterium]|nr:MAG: hypothetical protein COB72_11255 [bacterium]
MILCTYKRPITATRRTGAPMPRLTVIEGPDEGKSFVLPTDEPQLIGRSSEALPITDNTVSRRHSELTPNGDIWYLSDLKSQNGTIVNGVAIINRIRLEEGDQIRVGATVLLFGDVDQTIKKPTVLITDDFDLETEVEARIITPSDSYIGPEISDDAQSGDAQSAEAAVDHLRVIYTLTAITARIMNNRELLEAVMDLVFNEFKPERGVIMIPGATDEDQMVPGVIRYANEPKPEEVQTIHVSRTILNAAMIGEGVLSTNAMTDPRFAAGDSVQKYQIRSALCSPIVFGDHFFGAIYIDSSTQNHAFIREQLALLNAVGQHTGLALANADEHLKRVNSERMAAIGETVASLSHSIKNILQGLRGGADVVEIGLHKNDLAIAQNGWGIVVEFAEDDPTHWPVLSQKFEIRHLSNAIDAKSRTFGFFIPLLNQSRSYKKSDETFVVWRFRPGQRVRLHIPVEELNNVLVLPAAAVVREGPEAYVFQQNGDLFNRIAVHVLHEDRLNIVLANDGSVTTGLYLAQNAAASLNRVLKAQAASGMRADVHVHADGTVHASH